jgi:hypothetical protein
MTGQSVIPRRQPRRDYELQIRFKGRGFAWEHITFLRDSTRREAEEEMGLYADLHPDSTFRLQVAK